MNSIKSKTQNNNAADSNETNEVVVKEPNASIATSSKVKKQAHPVKTPVAPKVKTIKPAAEDKLANAEKDVKENKLLKKKSKLVRDSFTFPAEEYAQIGLLKQRTLKAGQEVKKSELIRAGLALLSASSDAALLKALTKIDKLKTGRPAQ
ncbi:MAG: hypothetical protein WCL27_05165 [Betaproteobacteria bacterium]